MPQRRIIAQAEMQRVAAADDLGIFSPGRKAVQRMIRPHDRIITQKLADKGIGMCRDGQLFLIRHAVAADILPAFIGKRASWDTRRVKQLRRERRHDDRAVISDHIHERFDQRLFTGHHIGQTPRGHFHEQHHPPGQTKAAQLFDQLRLRQHRIVHFSHIHIITHIHHPLYRLFYHIF